MDTTQFNDRVAEIEEYIDLLHAVDTTAQTGPRAVGGIAITARQQRMLYSSVYLHLYNLVEATATWCTSAVAEATAKGSRWRVGQLDSPVRREWIRANLRTHNQIGPDKRLNDSFDACEGILNGSPVKGWSIEKGGGGNWDDKEIENISERVGCPLAIALDIRTEAKRRFRDDMNALEYVKILRNKLAHGNISFDQSGENTTTQDLVDLKERTVNYLRAVLLSFVTYLDNFMYLAPAARPGGTP